MTRFVGIDVGAETHMVAAVDESGTVLRKSTAFGEDAAGYRRLRELLGDPDGQMVAMEATGIYWRNLFAALVTDGFSVALVNPLRTNRFAEEELARTKTDAMRSTLSASPDLRRRNGPHPPSCPTTRPRICAS